MRSFFNDFLDVQSKLFDEKARKLLWQLQQKVAFTAYTISNMDPGYTCCDISIYMPSISCNLFRINKHLVTVKLMRVK